MASTKEFLDYVLEQLRGLDDISYRPMMGEYVLYYRGKVVGGVYDDRFLLKATKSALQYLEEMGHEIRMDIPYEGAKEMLVTDIDDQESCHELIEKIFADLPEPKRKR